MKYFKHMAANSHMPNITGLTVSMHTITYGIKIIKKNVYVLFINILYKSTDIMPNKKICVFTVTRLEKKWVRGSDSFCST